MTAPQSFNGPSVWSLNSALSGFNQAACSSQPNVSVSTISTNFSSRPSGSSSGGIVPSALATSVLPSVSHQLPTLTGGMVTGPQVFPACFFQRRQRRLVLVWVL